MTPKEFYEEMLLIKKECLDERDDKELVHVTMDNLMCKLLEELGYGDGVEVFRDTPMWYA